MSQTASNSAHGRRNGGALALLVTGALLLTLSLVMPTGAGAEGDPNQVDPSNVPTTEDTTATTEDTTATTEDTTATTEDTTSTTEDTTEAFSPASMVPLPEVTAAGEVSPGDVVQVMNVPYPSGGKQCDESRDGWHLVMTSVETSGGDDPTAADFGPVTLAFSDGSSGVATFTDASGKVAHFLDATTNQTGTFTLESATMTFPAGTTVVSYGNFVISHPPCGTISTTTTTSPVTTETTTTTSPVTTETTTTTSPVSTETTTTTSPVSTETTSTTSPVSTATTPTTGPDGGMLLTIGEGLPIVTQAAATAPSSAPLPSTGIDGKPFIVAGLVLMASGGALWLTNRRRAAA